MQKLLTALNCNLFLQKSTILDISQSLSLTTINQMFLTKKKDVYQGFLERWLLLTSCDFTCSKSEIETLKTLEEDVRCVWS